MSSLVRQKSKNKNLATPETRIAFYHFLLSPNLTLNNGQNVYLKKKQLMPPIKHIKSIDKYANEIRPFLECSLYNIVVEQSAH